MTYRLEDVSTVLTKGMEPNQINQCVSLSRLKWLAVAQCTFTLQDFSAVDEIIMILYQIIII